ncbi:MAG: glycosyltransferase family 4 protein [Planctomycetes bacterium]|nr:glycosyltransferase family 4 protein [Planctomycetota bacterium]
MTAVQLANPVAEARRAPADRQTRAPLRVCMISDDFLPAATGVGVLLQSVSRELARRGHTVSIVTTRRPGEPELEIWEGVRVNRTFTLKVYGFYQALPSRRRLARLLREEDPQIVHYHYLGVLQERARRIARELKVRNVYTYNMTAEHLTQPWPLRPLRGLIARRIIKFCNTCDRVLVPSGALLQQIVREGVRAPSQFLSNPADFPARPEAGAKPAGPFAVLFAGRLEPEKNVPYLLDAFAAFARSCGPCVLELAGRGSQEQAMRRRAVRLGIADKVRFLGFLDHARLGERYAACDVFVLPSLVETQGMVAMEAMRFAKPVIVTDRIVSARELVDDGSSGFIVNADDAGNLTEKLSRLHSDAALRERMGLAGLARSERWGVTRIVDETERCYREVLAG